MPTSAILSFADPYEYQAAVRAADMRIYVTAGGEHRAQLTRIDLHQLWMQSGCISAPHVVHNSIKRGRSPVLFLANDRQQPMRHTGMEITPGSLLLTPSGSDSHARLPAGLHWRSMSLPVEGLAAATYAMTRRDLPGATTLRLYQPPAHLMTRLINLSEAAENLAATTPDILGHPEVARAVEQELVRVMIRCLTEGDRGDTGGSRHSRLPVMQRFEQELETKQDRPLYVAEICAAIGVSDRTLRLHCVEQLGMSPHRYLWLRRMNLARRALLRATSASSSVTGIALDHGFGELGRFAVGYRRLFGETPSTTLRQEPDQRLIAGGNLAHQGRLLP